VPPPSQPEPFLFVSLEAPAVRYGGGLPDAAGEEVGGRPSASSRLLFSASSRSTRSLHCNSNCRKDSCSARSVSDFGRQFEGMRVALCV
jgi:hypothetical protein